MLRIKKEKNGINYCLVNDDDDKKGVCLFLFLFVAIVCLVGYDFVELKIVISGSHFAIF